MYGLLNYMSGQRPSMQGSLLAALSNQGKVSPPPQAMAPMDSGAAQAMQAFQQAQTAQRQPAPPPAGGQGGGGLGGIASLFKLFMGG